MGLQELGQLLSRELRAGFVADAHLRRHQLGAEHESKPAHLEDAERVVQAATSESVGTFGTGLCAEEDGRQADTQRYDSHGEPPCLREPLASCHGSLARL